MRDLTKSLFSYSWVMSLFGVQQIMNLASPPKATTAFDAVTGAAENAVGDRLRGIFQAGDNLQRGMVDLTFGVLTLQTLDPTRLVRTTSDLVSQSAELARQGIKVGSDILRESAAASAHGFGRATCVPQKVGTGWGPMPGSERVPSPPPSQPTSAGASSGQDGGGGPSAGQPQGWGPMPDSD